MKVCKGCGVKKDLADFPRDATKKDGRVNKCKACRCADSASRYAMKRDEILAKKNAYRAANREKARQYTKEWATANPLKRRANQANYRARRSGAGGRHSAEDVAVLMQLQKGKCACCRASVADEYHVDHVLPLALGGTSDRENLQLLCPPCNMSKGAKHPVEFANQRGLLL
jgi:5-methylcytosine-specific restriction endonuclease McrA